MTQRRRINRRSFLGQVVGSGAGIGALAIVAGSARAQTGPYTGVTDTDSGSHADNAGHGRGPGGNSSANAPPGPQTGVTDRDPSDPIGHGRGGSTGYSDSDSGANADPSGRGRRGNAQGSGATDSDPADGYGQGRATTRPNRRRPDGRCVHHTGATDSDGGSSRDPSGYGHNNVPGSNLLPDVHCS